VVCGVLLEGMNDLGSVIIGEVTKDKIKNMIVGDK